MRELRNKAEWVRDIVTPRITTEEAEWMIEGMRANFPSPMNIVMTNPGKIVESLRERGILAEIDVKDIQHEFGTLRWHSYIVTALGVVALRKWASEILS